MDDTRPVCVVNPQSRAERSVRPRVCLLAGAILPGWVAVPREALAPPRVSSAPNAPLAQLDRASGYEPGGRRFESCRARHCSPNHSGNRGLGHPSSPVAAGQKPSVFAWQTAWHHRGRGRVRATTVDWTAIPNRGTTGATGSVCRSSRRSRGSGRTRALTYVFPPVRDPKMEATPRQGIWTLPHVWTHTTRPQDAVRHRPESGVAQRPQPINFQLIKNPEELRDRTDATTCVQTSSLSRERRQAARGVRPGLSQHMVGHCHADHGGVWRHRPDHPGGAVVYSRGARGGDRVCRSTDRAHRLGDGESSRGRQGTGPVASACGSVPVAVFQTEWPEAPAGLSQGALADDGVALEP